MRYSEKSWLTCLMKSLKCYDEGKIMRTIVAIISIICGLSAGLFILLFITMIKAMSNVHEFMIDAYK